MKPQAANLPRKALICLALGVITLAVFSPALTHEFLDYDDQQYVTENPHVQHGLSWPRVEWAFKTFYASNWHPVTWLSHMLDYKLYGLNPTGHHLTNVLLHTASVILLFLALYRITGAQWPSACVAALFAWHPMHVESVAWVAERKDVLSTLFFMLTLLAYARYAESKVQSPESEVGSEQPEARCSTFRWYWLSLLLFALGLMSKPMLVTLPFVLLLLDFWPLRRIAFPILQHSNTPLLRLLWEKLPFFALSAGASILTMLAQRQAHSVVSTAGLPISQRVAHALVAYLHYLAAAFVPTRLAGYYPYETALPASKVVLAGIVLALISLFALRFARRYPWLLVGWLWFLGTLVPVVGLVQVGDQAWADRYTYLPLVGIFIAVVWGAAELAFVTKLQTSNLKLHPARRDEPQVPNLAENSASAGLWMRAMAVAVGLALLITTSIQLRYWKNTRTLFAHAAEVTHNNGKAITVLGSLLAKEGKLDQAMALYAQALRYKPQDPLAHFFLGNALEQQGKLEEAVVEYGQALWFKPLQERTHLALGMVLARQHKYDEAAMHYQALLAINPESATAQNNLARVRHSQGRWDEAIEHYSAALKLDPGLAQAHNNLGVLLIQKGRLAEGAAQLREATRLRPEDSESVYNLALVLNQLQNWKESSELLARIEPGRPNDPKLHFEFGLALAHQQKTREAMSCYAHALLLQQDFPEALDRLSWILATDPHPELRNGAEAVRMAERACELTGHNQAVPLATLAAAYGESGRFPEAADTAQKARDRAAGEGKQELALKYQKMLDVLKSGKPWREPLTPETP